MAPKMNIDIQALARQMSRGAEGPVQGNISPSPPGMQPMSPASGGATSGLAANPARNGQPPVHMGAPAMGSSMPAPRGGSPSGVPAQPGQHPRTHSLTLASLAHLKSVGHAHPNHHAIVAHAKASIASAKTAGVPKPRGGFGALGGAGGGLQSAGGLMGSGGPSNIPGASAGMQGGPPVMED